MKNARTPVRSPGRRYKFVRGSDFVHLHLHSEYSLLDGACRISEIPAAAKRAGQRAVAITDHGVLYGAVDFYKACKKEGVRPIIGCEVYVAPRRMTDREHGIDSKNCHLVLLVKNETGYKNLIYMVSESFTEGFYSKPRIDLELLSAHSEGLCALSACLAGAIPKSIVLGDYEEAKRYALRLNSIFGDGNFYLELQDHRIPDQRTVNEGLVRLHEETGIPLVATNDVHYLNRSDAEVQSVLMCIQTNSRIAEGRPVGFETDEFWFKSAAQMKKLFAKYDGAIENTVRIADMCSFDFEFGHTFLPRYTPENGETPENFLRSLVFSGLEDRIRQNQVKYTAEHPEKEYLDRIGYELSVINSMGYTEYYLIVWDFIHYSKNHGIMVGPGRGSGAGSLCAFLIGIVDVDPIAYDLLFERFLNPERVSMPDFDVDFPDDKRDRAIEYVRRKYGEDKISQIITFGTMAAKAALRDVGRVLDIPYADVNSACAALPQIKDVTLKKALDSKNFRNLYESNDRVRRMTDIAMRLEGMPRHASVHAAGIVITDTPLRQNIPLAVNNGVTVTQFAMKNVEELGFLKFDFLALRYLTVIENCVEMIKEQDPGFSVDSLDLTDSDTFSLIARGDTDGVFQLEKGGMKRFLTQLRPHCMNDIIAAISLYRPGPMDSIPKYLENREHPEKITYPTPLLEPILCQTGGCIVFQEQVMRIFRDLAGYSLGRADIVRRAISKKKMDVLESERCNFIEGAAEHGVSEEAATQLFEEIVKFAEYAYNKSHATAYAMVTYRTAYLKCHYPLEYTCALLSSVMNDSPKVAEYISRAKSQGVRFSPPSVNESGVEFCVRDNRIVFGLNAIRNLGASTAEKIAAEARTGGRYTSVADFVGRTSDIPITRRQLEYLIKSGALDNLGANRHQLLSVVDAIAGSLGSDSRPAIEGQIDMFSSFNAPASFIMPELPDVAEYSARELLALEKESIGIYLSGHMLHDYSRMIADISPDRISAVISSGEDGEESAYPDRKPVDLCVIITGRTDKNTKRGALMTFIRAEDESGECEVIVFPEQLKKYGYLLVTDSALRIKGRVSENDGEEKKIVLESAALLVADPQYSPRGNPPRGAGKDAEAAKPAGTAGADRPSGTKERPYRRLFVRMDMSDGALKKRVLSLISIFDDGNDYALFYDTSRGDYVRDTALRCRAGDFLLAQVRELVGEGNAVIL